MIDTKEQYEVIVYEVQQLGYIALEGTGEPIIQTIEALREVARAAKNWLDDDMDRGGRIEELIDALPDWFLNE